MGLAARQIVQGDIDHELVGQCLQQAAKLRGRNAPRDGKLGDGLDQGLPRPGGAQALGSELLDVDPAPGDGLGDLPDDPGMVLAYQLQLHRAPLAGPRFRAAVLDGDPQPLGLQGRQCLFQAARLGFRDARQEDPGEAPTQNRDAALQPVTVVGGEGLGQGLDQSRPVCPHDGDDESGGHARIPFILTVIAVLYSFSSPPFIPSPSGRGLLYPYLG